jgi:uncharacterized SAM-binding protein YcdF (DUF218 family)
LTRAAWTRSAGRLFRAYLLAVGGLVTMVALWLVSPAPLFLNRPLNWNEAPVRSDAIVCLSSGADDGLPSGTGWQRIRTSVRLYQAGFAPRVVFTGGRLGDTQGRSLAEIYAAGAQVLGLPASACVIEPHALSTFEHPSRLLESGVLGPAGRQAAILVVTTPNHSLRAGLCFRKAGYSRFRVVTRFGADASDGRALSVGGRVVPRAVELLSALREWAALGLYRVRGWI